MAITWRAIEEGTATPAPTSERPDAYALAAPPDAFYTFVGSESPGLTPTASFVAPDPYAIYVETTTDRGRRQFKFDSEDREITLRFGYRYQVGLGSFTRDGAEHSFLLDLQELADIAEPGTTITEVGPMFVRVRGTMTIQVVASANQPAPPPPPDDEDDADNESELTTAEIVRFLNQATFGANDAMVAGVQSSGGLGSWIDSQWRQPASLTEPWTRSTGSSSNSTNRHEIWWQNVMEGSDQLRQRLAFAWSQIFVVSDRDYVLSNSQFGICNYYDMLAQHGDGNFRDLLERVTLHPVMGIYLSMVRNEKADPARNVRPDENFAREVLQLFTIGLDELTSDGQVRIGGSGQPIPTYDQVTIEEFAKVFTGWNFDGVRSWTDNNVGTESRVVPMIPDENFHDTSAKTLLNGTTLPAGQTAYADLTMALDNIFAHPNVGPFVARSLIQRFVTSNPTPQYVGRVAAVFNDDGGGVRGDLQATVKALLLDPEARAGAEALPDRFGKMKEPIMRLTNLWRAFDARPGPEAGGRYRPYARALSQLGDVLGQSVLDSPSVFNFYNPDNPLEPGSQLVAPEVQILTEINVASTNNMLLQAVYGDNNRSTQYRQNITQIQIEPAVELAADVPALLDRLDTILCGGQLPVAVRDAIETLIATHPDDDDGRYLRVVDAVYSIVGSPFHLVQK